jgi:hypothetical protein
MQIIGISAFDKTPVKELLTEFQINQNVKEQRDLLYEVDFKASLQIIYFCGSLNIFQFPNKNFIHSNKS